MSGHVKTPTEFPGWRAERSPEESGVKVVLRCAACGKALGCCYVHDGHVSVGQLSILDRGGIESYGEDSFRFVCTYARCDQPPFVMPAIDVAKRAERVAARKLEGKGHADRSLRLGPTARTS